MKAYQADIAKFEAAGVQVLGISVDSFAANGKFAEENKLTFPLLSDFKHTASIAYGIFDDKNWFATRATFVIDKDGIIQHIEQGNTAIDPTGAYEACSLKDHLKETSKPNPDKR